MDNKTFVIIGLIFVAVIVTNIINELEIGAVRNEIAKVGKFSSMNAGKIEKLNHIINKLNQTLTEIDNRTTTNNPVTIHNFYVPGDPLQTIINQCVMTQGSNSKVCQAEMKIDPETFYHPTVIDTETHHYTFTGDWKTWCRKTTDEFDSQFIIDLNETNTKQKCQDMWSLMK